MSSKESRGSQFCVSLNLAHRFRIEMHMSSSFSLLPCLINGESGHRLPPQYLQL
jgi:hypothetical protein